MSQRLSLLAHAATRAQRESRFPDDDAIEPIASAVVAAVHREIGSVSHGWHASERAAAETAAALGAATAPETQLNSWRMGSWQGRAVAEVAEQETSAFGAWRHDPDATPPGGESLRELLGRSAAWLHDVGETPRHSLLIADATVIRALVVEALGSAPTAFWQFDIAPLSLTVLQRSAGPWRVRCLGCDVRG